MKTGDLQRRATELQAACHARGMNKSHAMHVAGRLLGQVAELISIAEKIDGTDEQAELRRMREMWSEEHADAERLRERVDELEQMTR